MTDAVAARPARLNDDRPFDQAVFVVVDAGFCTSRFWQRCCCGSLRACLSCRNCHADSTKQTSRGRSSSRKSIKVRLRRKPKRCKNFSTRGCLIPGIDTAEAKLIRSSKRQAIAAIAHAAPHMALLMRRLEGCVLLGMK